MLIEFFRSFLSYNTRQAPEAATSETTESSDDDPSAEMRTRTAQSSAVRVGCPIVPAGTPPSTPTNFTQSVGRGRGRPAKRLTSSKRVNTKAGIKMLSTRKPLTPTTKPAIAKERKHKSYIKSRTRQAEMEKVLSQPATYWRMLRNRKKYRSFGGTRRA